VRELGENRGYRDGVAWRASLALYQTWSAQWRLAFGELVLIRSSEPEINSYRDAFASLVLALATEERAAERRLELAMDALRTVEGGDAAAAHYGFLARILSAMTCVVLGKRSTASRLIGTNKDRKPRREALRAVVRALNDEERIDGHFSRLAEVGLAGYVPMVRAISSIVAPPVQLESPLTKSELQVLREFAKGKSTKEVAQATGRSENTAISHMRGVMKKLGTQGRASTVARARELGLV
jgi:DNA-binding CsgD family transcriptional regulator